MHPCTPRSLPLLLGAMLCAVTTLAEAQQFGRNKVQYETFDFRIARTERFDIYFYPETRDATELTARLAERWDARLTRLLDHTLSSRQPLIMYAAPAHFRQTNVIGGALGEGTGGVTEGGRRRIVMPYASALADTDHVLGHELVHAYQYDLAAQVALRAGQAGMAGLSGLPLWYIEGMAEYLSVGRESPLTAMWVRDAILNEKLPTVENLDDPEFFPYRWGQALWAYIGGRWGDAAVRNMLITGLGSGDPQEAIAAVLGIDHEQLTADWHEALQRHYAAAIAPAAPMPRVGTRLTEPGDIGGRLNVSPSLSPDGRRVAFLSERDVFSIDLYVADAHTGEVIRQLTRTAIDPHYSSLQFIESAGAWSPDGARLAVAAVAQGRPEIAIYVVESGKVERRIRLGDLDGAFMPAWSPDGTAIALVGQDGGLSDLYRLDLASERLDALTDDAFAVFHPSWSPDGRQIAYATDRFTTDLEQLDFGALQLAVIDVASKQVRAIDAFAEGKHINPHWTPDGRGLVFIAQPDGIDNVYEMPLDGRPRRVTNLYTGVAGITATSPALALASRSGDLVFTAYEDGQHLLYRLDAAARTRAAETAGRLAHATAGILPPVVPAVDASASTVAALLANAALGLPASDVPLETQPYDANLQLDFVATPTVTVGADRLGGFGGGSLAFFLSDMLGNHSVGIAVQSNMSFNDEFSVDDIGGGVLYRNLSRRWNWGVQADQTPFRSGYAGSSVGLVDGTNAVIDQTVIFRQVDRGVSGLLQYPFNEAQRVEFSAGVRNLGFSQTVRTRAFDVSTGQQLIDDRRDLTPDGSTLTLGQASAALVYDTSSSGATSPILGQRYRFEASPTFGDISYTSLLADYRRYFMPVQFYTLAFRAMHYGRYGAAAEDPRLAPLFIGYPSLVRGYDVGTFEQRDCPPSADGSCEALDRLVGSRIAVANAEFRFPLLRPFGVNRNMYGPVPVEVALFGDAGAAWDGNDGTGAPFYRSDGKIVSSAGVALRVNALGFAIVQLSYAKPFQRSERGWVWQFSLAPGF